jgi:hypothetical protein
MEDRVIGRFNDLVIGLSKINFEIHVALISQRQRR